MTTAIVTIVSSLSLPQKGNRRNLIYDDDDDDDDDDDALRRSCFPPRYFYDFIYIVQKIIPVNAQEIMKNYLMNFHSTRFLLFLRQQFSSFLEFNRLNFNWK